jgi:hypothetical protein
MNAVFNELEWMRVIYLLADTEAWVRELFSKTMEQVPIPDKRRLFRKSYCITAAALVHILERHYYRVPRHPGAGKFTIPVTEILHWIREAARQPAIPLTGSLNFIRCFETGTVVGHDREGLQVSNITVITNAGGEIQTAFPGNVENRMETMTCDMLFAK